MVGTGRPTSRCWRCSARHLERIIAAYAEASPLADGWRERVALHQLHPVMLHAVLFGGGYVDHAAAIARQYA